MELSETIGPGGGPGRGPLFDVRVGAVVDGCVRVVVDGDVDLGASDPLLQTLVAALSRDGVARLRVDLGAVRLLDASGVGVLLAARNRARSLGVAFEAVGATGLPRRVLETLGVLEVLGGKE